MSQIAEPPDRQDGSSDHCRFFQFGLIVTGEGERDHLPKLFATLMASGICNVKVIKFIGQRDPRSDKRKLKMLGEGKTIPDRDADDIGIPARKFLVANPSHFVILVDDLESSRLAFVEKVFDRYRKAFDTILPAQLRTRASIHFLVNMLEAYYFADADATNKALHLDPPLQDYTTDVEEIPHPKAKLWEYHPAFRSVADGGRILELLNLDHVLSRTEHCASLRTLIAWCVEKLAVHPEFDKFGLTGRFCLTNGVFHAITKAQMKNPAR